MNLPFVNKKSALFFFFSALVFTACTKITTTDIGGSLLPPVDGVNTKEIFLDVISKNAADTIARVGIDDFHSLGYTNDPLFGTTTADINLQLKPSSFPFILPAPKDSLFIDSVVMVLNYKGAWGDTTQDLSFRVYEISNDEAISFRYDSIYPTNHVLPTNRELTENGIAKTVSIKSLSVVDSTTSFKEPTINQVRIRLNSTYGTELLRKYDTTNAYRSDTDYSQIIKGYQIVAQKTGNSLMKIALTSTNNAADTNTKMALYFHYQSTDSALGKLTSAIRYFRCNSTSATTNYVTHNRSGSQAASYLANTNANADLIFIDANPGIYSKIEIPGLDTITNKVIHRAELVMEQVPDESTVDDSFFTAPNLFIAPYLKVGDTTKRFTLPNDVALSNGIYGSVTNLASFGCYPVKKIDSITKRVIYAYSFDMSRYLQGIITRKEPTYSFIMWAPLDEYLYSSSSFVYLASVGTSAAPLNTPSSGRVRLGGATNTTHKMRFHIVYSDLP